jgi:hypothetical protein
MCDDLLPRPSVVMVADELLKIQILFDHSCMLRIGCKLMMLIT